MYDQEQSGNKYLTIILQKVIGEYLPAILINIVAEYYDYAGIVKYTLRQHQGEVKCLAILAINNKEYIISGSCDCTLKVWNTETYECIQTLIGHRSEVWCVAVFNDELIASGAEDGKIKLWNTKKLYNDQIDQSIKTLEGHEWLVRRVVFISEQLLVSGSFDNSIKIWNIETNECLLTLNGHTNRINTLTILSNEPIHNSDTSIIRIATGSSDCKIKIWVIKNVHNTELTLINQKKTIRWKDSIFSILSIPEEKTTVGSQMSNCIIIGSRNKKLIMRNMKTKQSILTIKEHKDAIRCIKILHDGRIISGSDDKTLKIWNINSCYKKLYSCDLTLTGHTSFVFDIVILSNGHIASCSNDKTIKIWM